MSAARGKKPFNSIAVIGFGSQGKAHAIRLSEAGFDVCVGLRSGSRSRSQARRLSIRVTTPGRAVAGSDAVAIMVPDRVGAAVLKEVGASIEPGALVVFAAGYPLVFPPKPALPGLDIVMVAPHGPGIDLEKGVAMSGFIGTSQDASGKAERRARAYAGAIGLSPLIETSPRQEALSDLFGEQTLLCGGLAGLTAAVVRTMIKRGVTPEHAYFETVAQLRQLADLLAAGGLEKFWTEISDCAAAGSAWAAPRLFNADFEERLHEIFDQIETGRFARRFQKTGRPKKWPAEWNVLIDLERAVDKKKRRPH